MKLPLKCVLAVVLLTVVVKAIGGTASDTNASALADLSLEELINIEVMSVGKKETRLFDAPAAIAVLTQEDIRRLGATSIPEALRAVPGMQVARISANRWAISARGLNDEYSNKLLVLVDGRSVYTPLFGGVHWNAQDVVLEDLDRIEIIRGPGATLWGANAVNGVVNIITKSAKETQGGLVSSSVGTEDQPSVTARYGGQLATNVFYRVYAKYFNREGFEDQQGDSMSDDWDMARGGLRVDWEASEQNTLTLSGDFFSGQFGEQVGKSAVYPTPAFQNIGVDAATSGGNLLGRWTSKFSEDSELKLQVYYDHYEREHPFGGGVLVVEPDEFAEAQNKLTEQRDTWDVDLQQRLALGDRHEFVVGVGFRRTQDRIRTGGTEMVWSRDQAEDDLISAFVQDEITLVRDELFLTLGSKFERNDYTGLEIQPAGRLMWKPTGRQAFWGSMARAVRNPTRLERDARINIGSMPPGVAGPLPVLVSALGNPQADSEELLAYEIGYRFEPSRKLSFDFAAFYNDYDLLVSVQGEGGLEAEPPPMHWLQGYTSLNDIDGHTYGTELLAKWQPFSRWRLTAGYTWWQSDFEENVYQSRTNPEHQVHLHSGLTLGRGWEFNAAGYFVGQVEALPQGAVSPVDIDSYFRLDLGLTWRPRDDLEFSAWGQNLLQDGHSELGSYKSPQIAQIPRTFYLQATWRF